MVKDLTVCVTGASGFIGSHVVRELLELGFHVRGTVRDPNELDHHAYLLSLVGAEERLQLVEAELLVEGSFDDAFDGCAYVIHTASPYVLDVKDPQTQLVDPAVKGTTNVLESCDKTGSIQRVVFTSSMAAISDETRTDVVFSERDWNEKSSLVRNPYYYSKMLAERAAWQFMEENPRFDLVAINPSVVIGPSLCPSLNTSNRIIRDLMAGQYPAIMNLSWVFVDVRDVAKAHALAMTRQEASGRYLCANSTLSMRQIVQLLKRNGYSDFAFPRIELTSKLADAFVRAASYTYPRGTGSYLRTHIGKAMRFDNQKIQGELGIEFIPVEQSVLETAADLLRWGHLKQR